MRSLGNPLGLVQNVSTGMSTFVASTAGGFQKSAASLDPTHAAVGVIQGTEALGRGVVGGLAQSASSISSTVANNLAAATFDSKFKRRRAQGGEEEVDNLLEGVGRGGERVLEGFFDGVTGAVMKPIRGAERHGLRGFGTGLFRGGLGLVLLPLIGVADGVTTVLGALEKGAAGGGASGEGGGLTGEGGGGSVFVARSTRRRKS